MPFSQVNIDIWKTEDFIMSSILLYLEELVFILEDEVA